MWLASYLFPIERVHLLKKIKEDMETNLDIIELLVKVKEIEILKEVLLNKDQTVVYNELTHPKMDARPEHKEKIKKENHDSEDNTLEIENSIRQLKINSNIEMNKKLLEKFEPE